MAEPRDRSLGESEEWEEGYRQTRRSLGRRRRRLEYFDWPGAGAWILDLAAGDGLDMQVLAGMQAGEVIGLDISPRLLADAQGERVVADAHRMPFHDGALDVVLANSVLHHLDPPSAFREIGRVLRPGGRLVLMEPRPCLARRLFDWFTLDFPPSQALPFFRARKTSLSEEMDVYGHWLRVYDQVPGWLAESGFVRDKEKRTLLGSIAQWQRT